jgi:hypothetical protein
MFIAFNILLDVSNTAFWGHFCAEIMRCLAQDDKKDSNDWGKLTLIEKNRSL